MKRKFLIGAVATVAAGYAHAQLGGLGGMLSSLRGGGSVDIDKAVASFNTDAVVLREAIFYSMVQITGALKNKEEMAKTKQALDAVVSTTNPNEAASIQGIFIRTNFAAQNAFLGSSAAKDAMAKLEPDMQQRVAKSIFAVGVAALRIPKTLDTGKRIVESVGSNPLIIPKALPVKDGLVLFADILPRLPTLVSTGMAMLREVKVDPGNPTAEAKLEFDKDPKSNQALFDA